MYMPVGPFLFYNKSIMDITIILTLRIIERILHCINPFDYTCKDILQLFSPDCSNIAISGVYSHPLR